MQQLWLPLYINDSKSQDLYEHCFKTIFDRATAYGFTLSPKDIMADFEKGLRNALKTAFPQSILMGCFFHFVEALWGNLQKRGLRAKP